MMSLSLLFTSAAMEFTWIYAFISIIINPVWGSNFPFLLSIIIFILSAVLTYLTFERGFRIITIISLQLTALLISFLFTLNSFYQISFNILKLDQILQVINPDNVQAGLNLIVIIISLIIFWLTGITYTKRDKSYVTIIDRFEKGIAAFVFIFFIEGITPLQLNKYSIILFISFFIFSILSITLSRSSKQGTREYLTNYINISIISVFIIIIAVFSISIFAFGLPYLTDAAEQSFAIFKIIFKPFMPLIVGFLRFMFNFKGNVNTGGASPGGSNNEIITPSGEENWLLAIIDSILSHLFIIIGIVIVLIISWILIKYLIKCLLAKDNTSHNKLSIKEIFNKLINTLKLLSSKFKYVRTNKTIKIYKRILFWGKIMGIKKIPAETPREYSQRLGYHFPFLKDKFAVIIDYLYKIIYGKQELDKKEEKNIKEAYHEIIGIKNWFHYLKFILNMR